MTETSFTISVRPEETSVRAKAGDLLSDALGKAGIPLSLYCHRRSICGKCVVRVVSGPLPLLEDKERALLEKGGWGPDHRLACLYRVRGDAVIEVPPASRLARLEVLESGISPPVVPDPQVRKLVLTLARPTLASPESAAEALAAWLDGPDLQISLEAVRRLGFAEAAHDRNVTAVLYGDREVLDVEPGDTAGEVLGLAVDVGTSTVVAEVVDLRTGESLGRASAVNSQISYGADVVSRITFAFQNPDGLERLRKAVVDLLNDLTADVAARCGLRRDRIYEAVIAGNTAMSHFLCGVPVDSLAMSPFHAVFAGLPALPAAGIGLDLHPAARVYLAPNIKSFVGGDITAGLSACGMAGKPGNSLFIDLGTNGEIVLKKGRRFMATSTAAGPAFEGMNIGCGMLALPGAIDRADWAEGLRVHTIDGIEAQGICGTGLIDILALALANGLVGPDGRIVSADKRIPLTGRLFLSQPDVRNVQLAVAAVKTGVRMMLREFGVGRGDIQAVYVAGAFGNSLDIRKAQAIGLLPDLPAEKVVFIGNSSLAGARLLLLSGPSREAAAALAARIQHVSLATRPGFQEEYVGALEFRPYLGSDE